MSPGAMWYVMWPLYIIFNYKTEVCLFTGCGSRSNRSISAALSATQLCSRGTRSFRHFYGLGACFCPMDWNYAFIDATTKAAKLCKSLQDVVVQPHSLLGEHHLKYFYYRVMNSSVFMTLRMKYGTSIAVVWLHWREAYLHRKRRTIMFVCLLNSRFIPSSFMVKGFDMKHIIVNLDIFWDWQILRILIIYQTFFKLIQYNSWSLCCI